MRNIDEDTITQAVIAHHAQAVDARLRDVMTSLVQHLHAFAREVQLTEHEWRAGIRFLTETGQRSGGQREELVLLSDTLGLSMLVTAMNHRHPRGCTEATLPGPCSVDAPPVAPGADLAPGAPGEPCFVRGQVRALDGTAVAGASVQVGQAVDADAYTGRSAAAGPRFVGGTLQADAQGAFHFRTVVARAHALPSDGPTGRLLQALGRQAWRPAHLQVQISAPGYRQLLTQVFRRGDPYLDTDAAFCVRRSLVADWVRHEAGPAPDGTSCDTAFYTLDFDFVLERA